ncbi:hypothetical protein ACMXYV_15815 [Neptuniibacter sp. SY11_33]|uniref:hypothetical protein n=1 Tax=Neptuniibacter sp. SY11_33 TaxID=3398215 RepID=UPI0039F563F0
MGNLIIPDDFRLVLEELQHGVIVLSKQNEIIWCNCVASSMFDMEEVHRVFIRQEQLKVTYEGGVRTYVFALPTKLGYPVSFSSITCSDFQVLISTPLVTPDLHAVRDNFLKLLEKNFERRANELVVTADTIRDRLQNGLISNRMEMVRQLNLLCCQGEELQQKWKDLRVFFGSLEGGLDRLDRINVINLTQVLSARLSQSSIKVIPSYSNEEYGVIYGDMGLLTDTLVQLVSSSLVDEANDREVTLKVHQGLGIIVWQWESKDITAHCSPHSELIWGFLGGGIQLSELSSGVQFSVRMSCGGSGRNMDRELAHWSELNTKLPE